MDGGHKTLFFQRWPGMDKLRLVTFLADVGVPHSQMDA